MKPTTCATAYFGGTDSSMCTWSSIRCPSSTRLSFCSASRRKTSPRCFRTPSYSTFLRHFGMKTTWYLHSHFVWLRLSRSSTGTPLVRLAAHEDEFLRTTHGNVKPLLPPRQ